MANLGRDSLSARYPVSVKHQLWLGKNPTVIEREPACPCCQVNWQGCWLIGIKLVKSCSTLRQGLVQGPGAHDLPELALADRLLQDQVLARKLPLPVNLKIDSNDVMVSCDDINIYDVSVR